MKSFFYKNLSNSRLWNKIGIVINFFLQSFKKKVPLIRQMTSIECGAACLSMILKYFGHNLSVIECRKEMGVGRDGASALGIAKAARRFGLNVNAYSIDTENLKYIKLPAIIHWNFNHFVVLECSAPKAFEIVDPAIGRYHVNKEEFNKSFTGVVITFEPNVDFAPSKGKSRFSGYRYLFKYLSKHLNLVFQIVTTSILIQIVGLALPLFTKIVIDSILPVQSLPLLAIFGSGMIILMLGQIVSSYLRSATLIYLQVSMDAKMMLDLFEHLLSLPLDFFQRRSSGDLIMRMGSSSAIREVLTGQTLSIILDGSLVIFYLIVILFQSPLLALVAFSIGLIQILIFALTTTKMQALVQSDILAQAESQSYLVESLSRIGFLKASGKESYIKDEWSNLFLKQLKTSFDKNHLSILLDASTTAVRILSPLILIWLGTYLVIEQKISLGTMLALNAFALAFLNPLSSLVASIQRLQLVRTHLERIEDIFEAKPEQDLSTVTKSVVLSGSIDINNLSFRYSSDAPFVLKNISLSIKHGQKIAIVGGTGSGKSTLSKLMLGLYRPTEGEILYNNIDLQNTNYQEIRNQIGIVLQETLLFSGSIRKNITFGNSIASFDHIIEASRKSEIHEEIMNMPMGYETMISEGNAGLSGGQNQRIALARAILGKPSVLILDEATSHLDVVTESRVDKNLSEMFCTRIIIAHRLSTIMNADLIFVLSKGEIIEQGTHSDLVKLNGSYAKLIKFQGLE